MHSKFSDYFHVVGVYRGTYFGMPVYNVCLGPAAACPMVLGFPYHLLKTHGWP